MHPTRSDRRGIRRGLKKSSNRMRHAFLNRGVGEMLHLRGTDTSRGTSSFMPRKTGNSDCILRHKRRKLNFQCMRIPRNSLFLRWSARFFRFGIFCGCQRCARRSRQASNRSAADSVRCQSEALPEFTLRPEIAYPSELVSSQPVSDPPLLPITHREIPVTLYATESLSHENCSSVPICGVTPD